MNCYVLVGGHSRRMGRSKVGLPFAGTTLLGHIVGIAWQAFPRVVAVQRPEGESLRGVETIFEPPHDSEAPIFGVLRALQHARARCFILAVDYPLITAEVLRFLRTRSEQSTSAMVVPVWSGLAQVLCAGYSFDLEPRIEQQISGGRLSLRSIAAGAEIIAEDDMRSRFPGEPLMNVNTPDDLQEAKRLYDQQGLLTSR
jgi:molybdopterin-guanine dinucleotide biosynthesis protein A